MRTRYAILISVLTATLLAIGCGGGAETNVNIAANTSNSNVATGNNVLAVTTPTPAATTNNAPTLTPMFKAYCLAMEKKDEAGIRKAYSKDTLEIFEQQMKEDGIKSLVEFLSTDNVTTALCEIRNETINGNEAVAELKTGAIPNGTPWVFVKEGNDWKLTNRAPALDSVKQTAGTPAQPAAANKPSENKAK